jgi:hypothetical protein
MPERFDEIDRQGLVFRSSRMSGRPTVGWLDDRYEVRFFMNREGERFYAVLCSPAERTTDKWNYTNFRFAGGQLTPVDDDVVLSPYHLVLLYELVTNHNPT